MEWTRSKSWGDKSEGKGLRRKGKTREYERIITGRRELTIDSTTLIGEKGVITSQRSKWIIIIIQRRPPVNSMVADEDGSE